MMDKFLGGAFGKNIPLFLCSLLVKSQNLDVVEPAVCSFLFYCSFLKNWLVQCTLNFQTLTLVEMQFLKNR